MPNKVKIFLGFLSLIAVFSVYNVFNSLSGKAIPITRTTACHAISYPITNYFNIPHGHAVGLTLGSILEYNSQVSTNDVLDPRGAEYVKKNIAELVVMLGGKTPSDAKNRLTQLMRDIGLATSLKELGIVTTTDKEIIVTHGFSPERVANNPRQLTPDNLRLMLNNL